MDQYAEAASSVVQNVVPDILSIASFIFGRGYVSCFVSLLTSLKSHTNRVELSFYLANIIGLFQGEFECSIMSFCNISPTCLFTSCSHANGIRRIFTFTGLESPVSISCVADEVCFVFLD